MTAGTVLVLNVGSATLKWSLFREGGAIDGGTAPWREDRAEQVDALLARLPAADAIGHRMVHGGPELREPCVVDVRVRKALEAARDYDLLHMGPALRVLDAAMAHYAGVPQVAAFDTGFHATLPEAAACYALPHEWTRRWDLRRFGFHGLSLESAVARLRARGPLPERTVVCHLGSGCSVTAIRDGRSADTSMGFSPLEGMMMGTRSGSVDPGLLLHLQQRHGLAAAELHEALSRRSGLLGLSGISGDFAAVQAAADAGVPRARLAVDRFMLDLRRWIGAMAGVLGGADALVFTGGVGEHSASVRTAGARALGLELDETANRAAAPATDLARPGSKASVFMLPCREDAVIRDHVLRVLQGG